MVSVRVGDPEGKKINKSEILNSACCLLCAVWGCPCVLLSQVSAPSHRIPKAWLCCDSDWAEGGGQVLLPGDKGKQPQVAPREVYLGCWGKSFMENVDRAAQGRRVPRPWRWHLGLCGHIGIWLQLGLILEVLSQT